ncbi:MAG: 50S ribosomal protein L4 [Candidatus Eisenbacteria bacterium]|uniref:Large ribosomal subunit protein uL4 n=1 Tax=Eiseniibacteriota bacterium TaxID=2212470 RepID=A0A956NDM5_UNCEI|nr:50S ribosomal protein L4 [Candidatus Eisenbacteria bacterium]MCB9463628.1 50S ribosomal protein L4 [Candidatus Eisenbacteria bacterium]
MASAQLRDPSGADKGTVELPAEIFEAKINRHVMWLSVVNYQNNQRQGTVKVKTRSEVSGGGPKPWRQKGTGRARAGTTRSNVWVKGGRAHGPMPRDHYNKLPKGMRAAALRSALTVRAKDGAVTVLTASGVQDGKTREVVTMLKALGLSDSKCLLVVPSGDNNVVLAGRNLRGFDTSSAEQINTYEVLWADHVLITEDALAKLKEVRG